MQCGANGILKCNKLKAFFTCFFLCVCYIIKGINNKVLKSIK